jgi:hypothetical protein
VLSESLPAHAEHHVHRQAKAIVTTSARAALASAGGDGDAPEWITGTKLSLGESAVGR